MYSKKAGTHKVLTRENPRSRNAGNQLGLMRYMNLMEGPGCIQQPRITSVRRPTFREHDGWQNEQFR